MLKKLIATLATFSLISVSATLPVNNLQRAIDEFNFAVTVDWDQQDLTFYNKAVNDFKRSIEDLSKEGMTNDEIIRGVIDSVKNKKQAAELQRMVGLLRSNDMTKSEVINFIAQKVRLTQGEGASYQGGRDGHGMKMLLVIGILVGISIYLVRDHDEDGESDHGGNGCGHGGGQGGGHDGDGHDGGYGDEWTKSSWNECMDY